MLPERNHAMIVQCRTAVLSSKSEPSTVLNNLSESSDLEWECAGLLLEQKVSRQKGMYVHYQGLLYDHKAEGRTQTTAFFLKHFLLYLFPVCNYNINCVMAAISIFRTHLFMQWGFFYSDMPGPNCKNRFFIYLFFIYQCRPSCGKKSLPELQALMKECSLGLLICA